MSTHSVKIKRKNLCAHPSAKGCVFRGGAVNRRRRLKAKSGMREAARLHKIAEKSARLGFFALRDAAAILSERGACYNRYS